METLSKFSVVYTAILWAYLMCNAVFVSNYGRGNCGVAHPAYANTHTANAGAVPRRGSDVGTSPLLGGEVTRG